MSLSLLILFIVVGLILILLDLFFIPGGVVAFFGLGLIIYADYQSFQDYGTTTGMLFSSISGIASAVLIWQFFRPSFWNRFGPKSEITGKMNTEDMEKVKPGDRGIAIGAIRPSGHARFGNDIIEVHAKNEIIAAHSEIEIIAIESNRIIVKQIES